MSAGIALLATLLSNTGPATSHVRLPAREEAHIAMNAIKKISTSALAAVSEGELLEDINVALQEGRSILQVGCSPFDIEMNGDQFRMTADLRLENERVIRSILIEGRLDRPAILYATQCGQRPIRPATLS